MLLDALFTCAFLHTHFSCTFYVKFRLFLYILLIFPIQFSLFIYIFALTIEFFFIIILFCFAFYIRERLF